MRLVYSYSFSHDLAIELGERIRTESAVGGMSSITFAAANKRGILRQDERGAHRGRAPQQVPANGQLVDSHRPALVRHRRDYWYVVSVHFVCFSVNL